MRDPDRTIVIAGGTGFLGRAVSRFLEGTGWRVTVLSRDPEARVVGAKCVVWDGASLGDWSQALEGAEAVLNLAGRSVNCRYSETNRREIVNSRLEPTAVLGRAIGLTRRRPAVWLNSSTGTIYRHAEDRPQDEHSGEIGSGFSVDVATAWEGCFFEASVPDVRRIALRSAMVMGADKGGAFATFRTLVRFRLGGSMGPGTQYVSWIHVDDFCRAILFLLEREDLSGIFNVASPNPLRNSEFMEQLRRASAVRLGLPSPRWMLELGAFVLRTETELPLKSRFVVPTRLLDSGFRFRFTDWESAAIDLMREGRGQLAPNAWA